jgi:hypothetical protein
MGFSFQSGGDGSFKLGPQTLTPPSTPSGAPPVQANTSGGSGGSTTNTQTFTVPVTSGNLLVLYIFDSTDLTTTISSVVWSSGGACGTFTPTPLSPITGTTRRMWVYYAQITTGGCVGVTITFSASINSVVIFSEYPGMATSGVLDVEVAANGTGTAISSGPATTTNANDLLVGGIFVTSSGGGTLTAGSGYALRVNNASTSHRGLEDQNVNATGSYAATASYSSSQTWIAHLMALKRTSSSGVRTPTSFFVSNAGNDANTGLDAAHSWAHAPGMTGATGVAASTALIPGDAVHLNRGDSWLNTTLTVPAGGSASGQITLTAYGTGARPIISAPASSPAITVTAANMGYWTIDNIDLRTSGNITGINLPASIYHNYWASDMLPVPNWIIQNCNSNAAFYLSGPNSTVRGNILDGTPNSNPPLGGIVIRGQVSTNALIDSNTVSHFADRGIWVFNGAINPVIRYNTVHDIIAGSDNQGMGINVDGANIAVTGAYTYGNLVYSCAGIGITHENGAGSQASYNLIHDCAQGGIDVINYTTFQTQPTNITISYNVIYRVNIGIPIWDAQTLTIVGNTIFQGTGTNSQGFGIQSLDTNVSNLTFQNNIIAGAWTHPVQVRTTKAIWTAFDYNDVVPAGTEVVFQAGTSTSQTLAQLQALSLMQHGITGDPLLASPPADLSLQAGSPAFGTGANLGTTYQQALQSSSVWTSQVNLGPQRTQWNMGAYL